MTRPYDIAGYFSGKPASSRVLAKFVADRASTLPAGATNSQGHLGTAANAQTDFDLKKNGVSVGTMRFAAAATVATFIAASPVSLTAGDRFEIVAPASPDLNAADISFGFAFTADEFDNPGFSATRTTAQTISDATPTKIQFSTETFDTHGYFDNATNYRFTPLVAGKYIVVLMVRMVGGFDQAPLNAQIWKNGAILNSNLIRASGASTQGPFVAAIIDMNGSTDYLEGYIRQDSGGNMDIEASTGTTFMMAMRIGP